MCLTMLWNGDSSHRCHKQAAGACTVLLVMGQPGPEGKRSSWFLFTLNSVQVLQLSNPCSPFCELPAIPSE